MTLSPGSRKRLEGVHPSLVAVVERAAFATSLPFIVTEGLRTEARQRELVLEGKSRTMKSRHLTGHAVDLAVVTDGVARWDWDTYKVLASIVKAAAAALGIPVEWGGEAFGPSFRDGPHFQLPHKEFPA